MLTEGEILIGRGSPSQYNQLARETLNLQNTLDDLQDLVKTRRFEKEQEQRLLDLGQGVKDVLLDLRAKVDRHRGLTKKSKNVFDRLGWDQADARDLRSRLISNVSMLLAFQMYLVNSSFFKIQNAMITVIDEVRAGNRDSDSISVLTSASNPDSEDDWKQLIRELEDGGITSAVASEHKALIVDLVSEAINTGRLDNTIHSYNEPLTPDMHSKDQYEGLQGSGNPKILRKHVNDEPHDLVEGPESIDGLGLHRLCDNFFENREGQDSIERNQESEFATEKTFFWFQDFFSAWNYRRYAAVDEMLCADYSPQMEPL